MGKQGKRSSQEVEFASKASRLRAPLSPFLKKYAAKVHITYYIRIPPTVVVDSCSCLCCSP